MHLQVLVLLVRRGASPSVFTFFKTFVGLYGQLTGLSSYHGVWDHGGQDSELLLVFCQSFLLEVGVVELPTVDEKLLTRHGLELASPRLAAQANRYCIVFLRRRARLFLL